MVTVIITEKGASMKSNKWKEGQEVSCHPTIADLFIKRGIATELEAESIVVAEETKPKKEKKK